MTGADGACRLRVSAHVYFAYFPITLLHALTCPQGVRQTLMRYMFCVHRETYTLCTCIFAQQMPSGATSARVPSARARQLSARAAAHHGEGLKPTAPQEPPTKKPPTHRRVIDVPGGKGYGTSSQLVPQPPSATNGVGKLSLYQSLLQKQEEQANELPQRTKQEPTVPLTARADGGGAGADVSNRKPWYNEGLAAPVVPLSARNSHPQAPSVQSKDDTDPSRLDSHRGGGDVDKPSLPMNDASRRLEAVQERHELVRAGRYP